MTVCGIVLGEASMVRIVTVNLAESQELSFEQDTPLQAPTPDVSLEITQLVHMASRLLLQGEVARAQQVLLQACALAPLPGHRQGSARTVGFTAARGAWKLISTKPAPSEAEAPDSGGLVSEDARRWPVRIRALGGFEILIDGVPFSSGIKPQRRPLDLLKLLVLADAAPIGAGELADKLWPDSDGDTARNCLQVAVHRLRRLLGHEQAVLVHDRKLHLDRKLCRVDLWEFEAEVARLTDLPIGGSDFASRAARALSLYRGHLFSHETDQAWMLAPRERLRRTWLDLVRRLGRHHETRGEWEAGSRLYQRAIELDPLAEEIYRRLMLCQHTIGQRNEALCTYRRCRKQLAAVLGVEPSAETERLYRVLCSEAS
jgi:DNA-binding SARP family transcriptional activator